MDFQSHSLISVFAAQFLQPRLFQYLIFVDLGVVTKVGTMVSFVGMFGVFGCSIVVDKLRLDSQVLVVISRELQAYCMLKLECELVSN